MKLMLIISFILNLIITGCEILTFSKIRKKINILKYYTFLQNFLALVVSILFSIYLIIAIFLDGLILEFVKGMRYVTTCGLVFTMIVYVLFLSSNKKNLLSEDDFNSNFSPKKVNFIFHYFCPIVSLISFVLFERHIVLTQSEWTLYAAIPSALYWIIYLILSITNLWEEPYDFSFKNEKKINKLLGILIMILIPLVFIFVSYILWIIK